MIQKLFKYLSHDSTEMCDAVVQVSLEEWNQDLSPLGNEVEHESTLTLNKSSNPAVKFCLYA